MIYIYIQGVIKNGIGGTKQPGQILRNLLTIMEMLPTWRCQIFRSLSFVDTLWRNFTVYSTNNYYLNFLKESVDEELKLLISLFQHTSLGIFLELFNDLLPITACTYQKSKDEFRRHTYTCIYLTYKYSGIRIFDTDATAVPANGGRTLTNKFHEDRVTTKYYICIKKYIVRNTIFH